MECPNCKSIRIKKNGISHTGKQNYYCHTCKRQFLENGSAWFIRDDQKDLVDKLLLERISLAGIIRVVGVSQSWLSSYIKKLYESLPDDLNASTTIPDIEAYLDNRMDEEISRIELVKKIQIHWRNTKK